MVRLRSRWYRWERTNGGSSPTRDQRSGHAPEQCLSARQYEFEAKDVSSRYEKQHYHPQNDCHNAERNTMPQKARRRFSRDKSPTYQKAKPKHFSQRDKTISNTEQPPLQKHENASSKIELEGLPSDSPPRNSGGMLRNLTLLCNFAHGGAESIRLCAAHMHEFGQSLWCGGVSLPSEAAHANARTHPMIVQPKPILTAHARGQCGPLLRMATTLGKTYRPARTAAKPGVGNKSRGLCNRSTLNILAHRQRRGRIGFRRPM